MINGNNSPSIARIGFFINGNQIGNILPSSSTPCNWENYYQVWNSGSNTQIDICIKELTYICDGADFAIDDIYFAPICYQTKTVEAFPVPEATIQATDSVCQFGAVPTITFEGSNGTSEYTFSYTDNSGNPQTITTNGSNQSVLSLPNNVAGTFSYTLTNVRDAHTGCNEDYTEVAEVKVNPLPGGTITGNDTVCKNDTEPVLLFTGNTGSRSYEFTYSINSGSDLTVNSIPQTNEVSINVPTSIPGVYTYKLTKVKDLVTGCEKTLADSVVILVNDLPQATLTGNDTVCLNVASDLTFSGSSANASSSFIYTYNGRNDTISSTGNNQSILSLPNDRAGLHTYTLIEVIDSATQCRNTLNQVVQILVRDLPAATISLPAEACLNGTDPEVIFTGMGGTEPYRFTYTINNSTPSEVTSTGSSVSVSHPSDRAGVYRYKLVKVSESSAETCWKDTLLETVITIHDLPVVEAGADTTICDSTQIILRASGAVQYSWNNNVSDGVPFIPSVSGYYVVEGTDNNNCKNRDSLYLTLAEYPVLEFSDMLLEGCSPLQVIVPYTYTEQLRACSWKIGQQVVQNDCQPFSRTFTQPGCYDLTLTATSTHGCTSSITRNAIICVHPDPTADFELSPMDISTYYPVVTTSNHSGGASSYVWNFGDGSSPVSGFEPSHTYPSNTEGNYTVKLVAISAKGCMDSAYRSIHIKDEIVIFVPNAFTPDGNEINQDFKPVLAAGIDIYQFNMKIFDRWGELIFETNDPAYGWDGTYNNAMCQDGTYIWKINFKSRSNDRKMEKIGHVNLLR